MKQETENKTYTFKTEGEREVGVCIAIQKIGLASISDIIEKIENWNGKLTEKQAVKCSENLRRRGLLSIDLSTKDEHGISIQKYGMKSIKLSIPEVAQIKDIVDDESLNPLKEELDRSKKTQKKGMKTFDYYVAEVAFKTKGDIQGFIPDSKGIIKHYREGKNVIFYPYHFKNWFRDNLPLINRASTVIGDIKFQEGIATTDDEMVLVEKYITNIESGFHGSKGTGGRGSRIIECLPKGTIIKTSFVIPRQLIAPEKFEKALKIITGYGGGFGGGAKLSTGRLVIEKINITESMLWNDED